MIESLSTLIGIAIILNGMAIVILIYRTNYIAFSSRSIALHYESFQHQPGCTYV